MVPKNKTELIKEIESSYQKLKMDFASVPDSATRTAELEGHVKGAKISLCDIVAYLIGWGELVLKWHWRKEKGHKVDFPETGYKWNELGKLAQKFYADYRNDDITTLLTLLDKTVGNIIGLIIKTENEQLYETPWYGKWTLGRMIQFNTSSPYKNAHGRIIKWKKQKGF
ncbi:MAG: ClbS/DfsB family four-helix bundle protein [Elusimicrobiales bacterium]|nr:ClbS/DfsB family four-helix bundle protein [Elusimicrobiales bacterium]